MNTASESDKARTANNYRNLFRYRHYVFIIALMLGIFTPIILSIDFGTDWQDHAQFADNIRSSSLGSTDVPHVLYHLLSIAFVSLLPFISLELAGRLLVIAALVATILIMVLYLSRENQWRVGAPAWWCSAFGSIIVMLIVPLVVIPSNVLMIGYLNMPAFHNPTTNFLKPFALAVSLYALQAIDSKQHHKSVPLLVASASLVTVLMIFAKPSYALVLLPGFALVVGYRYLKQKPVDWLLALVGVLLPMLFVLGVQYVSTFGATSEDGIGIGLAFVQLFHVPEPAYLTPMLLLSLPIPLLVTGLYFEHVRRDPYMTLSWIVFGISLPIAYFVFEDGPRSTHGNFIWSAQIALLVLHFACLRFLVRYYATLQRLLRKDAYRLVPIWIVLNLHFFYTYIYLITLINL